MGTHKNFYADILCAAALAGGIFILLYFFLGFAKSGIDAPYVYMAGDDLQILSNIKSVGETGQSVCNDFLGAPLRAENYDFPTGGIEDLLTRFIYTFTNDPVITVNIQFLMIFSFCSISGFCVLRAIKMKRELALFGALLFALAPFIFGRNISHFTVSSCYFIPLSVLLCTWSFQEDERYLKLDRQFFKMPQNTATIIFSFLIATNSGAPYYAFFTCFFLCVVGICKTISQKRIDGIRKPLLVVGCIFCFFVIKLIPNLMYQIQNGNNLQIIHRPISDSELYGLKIAQFFIPLNGHGLGFLDRLIHTYNTSMPLVNENVTSYLGVGALLGFLISLIVLFVPKIDSSSAKQRNLYLFSRLNISAILLGTIGGFSGLLAFVIPFIRGYNRISIFVMFISICTLCICLQRIQESQWSSDSLFRRWGLCICFVGLIAVCLFDQLPSYGANDASLAANKNAYLSDQRFITEIEGQLQENDMVFQFPYHKYPESGPENAMSDYRLFIGYLHSDTLRWSYGGMKGRPADQWNEYVSGMPVQMLINTICASGFRGIYIDTLAYTQEGLKRLQGEIESVIGEEPLTSEDNILMFYNLYPYIANHPEVLLQPPLTVEDIPGRQFIDSKRLSFLGNYELSEQSYSVIMHPESIQYGPYISLEEGNYTISVIGESLDVCSFDATSAYGTAEIPVTECFVGEDRIEYTISLETDTDQIEFRLYNYSETDVRFDYLFITKNS